MVLPYRSSLLKIFRSPTLHTMWITHGLTIQMAPQILLLIIIEPEPPNTRPQGRLGPSTSFKKDPALSTDVDMWSVIWYLGAFGGLVTFFIIVTCSEWCFGNHIYTRHGTNQLYINAFQSTFLEAERTPETPPPPYHLFAPPSYSDLFGTVTTKNNNKKKSKINIFIIPIHRGRRDETASAS